MSYNQYLSISRHKGRIYSKEVHTLTREIELKSFNEYPFDFFIPDTKGQPSGFTDINGNSLTRIRTNKTGEFKKKVSEFKDYGYSVYGTDNLVCQYVNREFDREKFNNKLVRIAYFDIETARDPVTGYSPAAEANNKITTISLVMNGKVWYWARKDLPSDIENHPDLKDQDFKGFEFRWFMTEEEMLEDFMVFVANNVDIISGWNIEQYDITYLVTRALVLELNPKKLSPYGQVKQKTVRGMFGNDFITYTILGVAVMDYLNLYKKFTYVTRENYKLDNIAYVELNDKKIDYSEYKNLDELYENDFVKFSIYNIKDSLICHRLENKLKLIDLAITLAYKTGACFEDTLGTVKIWTVYLYQEMLKDKQLSLMRPPAQPEKEIVGGFVKEPLAGLWRWAMSFDLASLYPHNQMGMNISFDKLVPHSDLPKELLKLATDIWAKYRNVDEVIEAITHEEIDLSILKKYNLGMTPNVQFYKNDSLGVIPRILKGVYNERKAVKKEMLNEKQKAEAFSKDDPKRKSIDGNVSRLNAIQMALKILMNSEYGALGNAYFPFFDTRNAEAITSSGQVAIKWVSRALNGFMNSISGTEDVDYILATDTDSVYLNFGPVVEKYFKGKSDAEITDLLDKAAKEKVQPFIDKTYHKLTDYLNGYNMEWFMKREAIASSAFYVKKKRYFMSILDDEGVRMKKPKLKVTGLEAVRSSTPEICRNALKKVMMKILTEDEDSVQKEIKRFKEEFMNQHIIDICFPKSVNNIDKWTSSGGNGCKSGTPIQVRSAIVFNNAMKKKDPLYETIKSGDKIKYCYLREPNVFMSNVIAFPNELPEKLGLTDDMVDKHLQFEKTYLMPVHSIIQMIGWTTEKQISLDSFFD